MVTYGGLSADLPLLTLGAMQYQRVLPQQLRYGQRGRFGEIRPHMDFALALKDQGREWAHLSEIGLRMGMPRELFVGKADVEIAQTPEE